VLRAVLSYNIRFKHRSKPPPPAQLLSAPSAHYLQRQQKTKP